MHVPTPPDRVVTIMSPFPLACPVLATILFGDFHSADNIQSIPHIRKPVKMTQQNSLDIRLIIKGHSKGSGLLMYSLEDVTKILSRTHEVSAVYSKIFTSYCNPCSWRTFLGRDTRHLGRRLTNAAQHLSFLVILSTINYLQ